MASLDSVSFKMFRAGKHWEELKKEVADYLETRPGGLVEMPDSTPERKHHRYREVEPLPARIGLIAGDCLQNMRSALDYLTWELVLANGQVPTDRTMFPVAKTKKAYQMAVERKQVEGIHPKALALIDALQPYKLDVPERHALYTLDLLTNINKHRHVPLTGIQGVPDTFPIDFLHIPVSFERRSGEVIEVVDMRVFVSLEDSIAKGREVCFVLNMLAKVISQEVLPLFKEFFK